MFDPKLMVSKSGFDIIWICLQKMGKYIRGRTFTCQHSIFSVWNLKEWLSHRVSAVQFLQQSEISAFGKATLLVHQCQQAQFLRQTEKTELLHQPHESSYPDADIHQLLSTSRGDNKLYTFSIRSRHSALSIQSMASHCTPSLWGLKYGKLSTHIYFYLCIFIFMLRVPDMLLFLKLFYSCGHKIPWFLMLVASTC